MNQTESRGRFITFEGGEGAGKSSLIARLAARLGANSAGEGGQTVTVTREPGSGEFGAAVRKLLFDAENLIPKAELFLFLADRAQHLEAVVQPALAKGHWVLCDRHADSTLVYQSFVRGLDEPFVRAANAFATGGLLPDLTILLDIEPEIGLSRVTDANRLDRMPLAFHEAVRAGYHRLASEEPGRWVVIDASASAESVVDAALDAIRTRL